MTKLSFAHINHIDSIHACERMKELPDFLQVRLNAKKDEAERCRSLTGYLLLKKLLCSFQPEEAFSLLHLQFSDHGRPYFTSGFQFNISHSGNFVVCAASDDVRLGVDVEQVHPVPLTLYEEYFSELEWKVITRHKDPLWCLIEFWTRKEAVLKATGLGFHIEPATVEVIKDVIPLHGALYYLREVKIAESYICYLATTPIQPFLSVFPSEIDSL